MLNMDVTMLLSCFKISREEQSKGLTKIYKLTTISGICP